MIKTEELFKIGRFYKPHGVSGEINFAFTDDVFDRTQAPYWIVEIDGIFVPFFVESYRFRSDSMALVKMEDIDNEQDAKLLADHDVYYPKAYADTSEMEEIPSWQFFEGFRLMDKTGASIGTITAVDDSTMNVLFQVKLDSDGSLRLLPAADDFIVDIDPAQRCLQMDFPDELLQLD